MGKCEVNKPRRSIRSKDLEKEKDPGSIDPIRTVKKGDKTTGVVDAAPTAAAGTGSLQPVRAVVTSCARTGRKPFDFGASQNK